MILNNGANVLNKFEKEDFPDKIDTVRIDGNANFNDPNITASNIENNSALIVDLFDSELNTDNERNVTENEASLMATSLANFIRNNVDSIEPEMRLYGVDENYFETIDELLKYCRQKKLSTQNLTILDYYRNFYDCKDVIRKTNSEISMFYAISNEYGYVWYADELNMPEKNWEFNHGKISSLYKPFRDHGIVFEDDIYARDSERTKHILEYGRKHMFNNGEKDKK